MDPELSFTMSPLFALVPALALLTACASTPPSPAADNTTIDPPAQQVEPPERPIPEDSLYPLLVAEFALRNRQYDLALDHYMEQSQLLRDPGVSAHTTHLAQFLRRETEARKAAALWVELEPDNVEANSTLATLLVRQGRTVEALPHLATVLEQGGDPKFPILLTGFEDLEPAQQAELSRGLRELSGRHPDNIQLLLTEALILAQEDKFDQAEARLDRIFKLEPGQEQAILLEAKILLTREDPAPFKRMEKTLEKNPDNQRLRLQYARLLAVNDLPAARKQFEILSAQSPRDGDLLLSLALINREIGDDLEAKAYLRQMIALGQNTGEANYYLGRIAEDADDVEAAIYHFKQVDEGGEFLAAVQRVGHIQIDRGQLAENHAWFEEKRAEHPGRGEQLYAVEADLLTQAGHPGAAMAVLNQSLEQLPDSNSLRYSRAMLGEQQGNLALMESDLRNIIDRDPDNATALNALGYTLANRTERYEEAYALISRALQLQPEEPAILDSMGWILYRRGEYNEALEYLTRAYAVFPDPEVAAHLGEVLWASGDSEGARLIWQGALLKDPNHGVLLATLKRFGVTDLATPAGDQAPR